MARQTSKSAYESIMRNGTLSQRRRDVYQVLYKEGPLSASEVCTRLGLPRDSVSPRLSELQRLSIVREFGTKTCSITGQTVVAWDVTGSLPRGDLKTKPRRRWCLAIKSDKTTVFQSRAEAFSYAKKNRGTQLIDVIECKSKPEKLGVSHKEAKIQSRALPKKPVATGPSKKSSKASKTKKLARKAHLQRKAFAK